MKQIVPGDWDDQHRDHMTVVSKNENQMGRGGAHVETSRWARFRIKFVIHFMNIDCTYILAKKFKTTHRK
jgi:hypothetical protein